MFLSLTQKYPQVQHKLVEDKANGPAIISALHDRVSGIIAITPRGSKEARLAAVSAQIESGNVYLPNPANNPWVEEFIDETIKFPASANDDQVDAMSQALYFLPSVALSEGMGESPVFGNARVTAGGGNGGASDAMEGISVGGSPFDSGFGLDDGMEF